MSSPTNTNIKAPPTIATTATSASAVANNINNDLKDKIQISIYADGIACGNVLKVRYDGSVEKLPPSFTLPQTSTTLSCYGIVGKLSYGPGHLVLVTQRELVVDIEPFDAKIWKISQVILLPLDYEQAKAMLNAGNVKSPVDPNAEEIVSSPRLDPDVSEELQATEAGKLRWRKWFLNRSPSPSPEPTAGVESQKDLLVDEKEENPKDKYRPRTSASLVAKMVAYVTSLFSSGAFYYADNWDLTDFTQNQCRIGKPQQAAPTRPTFCYNYHMGKCFHNTPLELYVMQGYIGSMSILYEKQKDAFLSGGNVLGEGVMVDDISERSIDCGSSLTFLLISRKSTKRPGVRYNRRGIDPQGYCANWVETEQSLIYGSSKSCSTFLQLRGSLPLYFGQSPYKLRPTPRVIKSKKDTEEAFSKHFDRLARDFNEVVGINLVEMPPSKEGAVGCMYSDLAFDKGIYVEWFDFHDRCKGMQFSQVNQLFETEVGAKLLQFGWTDLEMDRRQSGVFRVNCVDCLDRTNVVETTIARKVLDLQMADRKIKFVNASDFYSQHFRRLWADNGDAISRQYSSTNALKGDFTRTSKRQYKGILTDAYLTLSRYFHGMVSDFFAQAVIDYMLGSVDESVFTEFEQHLESRDPAINFTTVRQSSIDVASSIVLQDNEALKGGWWVQTPRSVVTSVTKRKRAKLVESIFLISTQALYICEFDLVAEKVTEYHRIPIGSVMEVQMGAFFGEILSPITRDPTYNKGFMFIHQSTESNSDLPADLAIRVPCSQAAEYDEIFDAVANMNRPMVEKDIVTLAEATSDTKLWGRLEYFVKKAVWA